MITELGKHINFSDCSFSMPELLRDELDDMGDLGIKPFWYIMNNLKRVLRIQLIHRLYQDIMNNLEKDLYVKV
jgi:hypothetical protein